MAKKAPFPYVRTFFAWFLALLIFFPLFWLGITAFKTEGQAIAGHLIFTPTLASFVEREGRSQPVRDVGPFGVDERVLLRAAVLEHGFDALRQHHVAIDEKDTHFAISKCVLNGP